MNKIKVTVTEKPRECQIYDTKFRAYRDGTLERLLRNGKWRFVAPTIGKNGYSYVGVGKLCLGNIKERVLYHRIIYYAFNQDWDIHDSDSIIDHIDRNRLNNAIANLRVATKSQNCMNSSSKKNRGNIGAFYRREYNYWSWYIRIMTDGKIYNRYIKGGDGKLPDPLPPVPQKIIDIRNELVRQYHGEFAVII